MPSNVKDATFELNNLTGTDGFDATNGTCALATTTPMKGSIYFTQSAGNSYGRINNGSDVGTLYTTFYYRLNAAPGSTARIAELRTLAGTSVGPTLRVSADPQLRLYNTAGTNVANVALTVGVLYRIGWRVTKGTGANGVVEVYVSTTDTLPGSPSMSISNDTLAADFGSIRYGSTTSTFVNGDYDNVRVDTSSMPTELTSVDKTYTLAASFNSVVTKTYTLTASFQASITKTYTLAASFMFVPDKTYTLAASFQATVNKAYTFAAAFQGTVNKDYTLAASFQFVYDKTYTLAAAFSADTTKTYTFAAAFSGTVDKAYTFTAAFRNTIDKAYTLAASFSLILDKSYTLAASFAVATPQIIFPSSFSTIETVAYLTDEFGQGATVLPVITAKYTGAINALGSFVMTIPSSFPLALLREDCWIEFWRSYNGGPLYLDTNKGFYLRKVDKRLDGKGIITLSGPSHNAILNTRSIAYGKRTAQTHKTMAADSMLVDLVNDNLFTPATDPKRRINAEYFSVKPAAGIAPVIEREFTNAKLLSSLVEVAKQSRDEGTRLFFDVVRVAAGLLEFRTYTNYTGIDRSQTGKTLHLSYENGNLDNVSISIDYSNRASVVYALGAGSGDNRLVSGYEDTGYTSVSPIARKEAFVDAKGATTPAALVSFARSEVQRLRPRYVLSADIISKPDAPYGAWRLGDLVEISAETYTATMMIDKVSVELSNGIEKRVVGSGEGIIDE